MRLDAPSSLAARRRECGLARSVITRLVALALLAALAACASDAATSKPDEPADKPAPSTRSGDNPAAAATKMARYENALYGFQFPAGLQLKELGDARVGLTNAQGLKMVFHSKLGWTCHRAESMAFLDEYVANLTSPIEPDALSVINGDDAVTALGKGVEGVAYGMGPNAAYTVAVYAICPLRLRSNEGDEESQVSAGVVVAVEGPPAVVAANAGTVRRIIESVSVGPDYVVAQ